MDTDNVVDICVGFMEKEGIKVLWNRKTYDVNVNPASGLDKMRESLYQLTGVPVERQKIMPKSKGFPKGMLKESVDFSGLPWDNGVKFAMMGSSTGIPEAPKEVQFVEDMSAKEQQELGSKKPPGLVNLGNTCYMNSTLQCLRAIPELKKSLEALDSASATSTGRRMTVELNNLFNQMDATTDTQVTPYAYVTLMRQTFPQFAQMGPKGAGFSQQDADEYFNALVNEMSAHLTSKVDDVEFGDNTNAIDALFGIDTTVEMKCVESEEEPVVRTTERLRRLQCKIDENVNTLEEGIKLSLTGSLEKNSAKLGRNAQWSTTQKLHRVPLYLVVQFNRFFWKLTPNSRDHTGVNCKIKKPVKFPLELDIHEFCDDDLKEILKPARDKHTAMLVARAEKMAQGIKKGDDEDEDMEDAKELQAALNLSATNGRTAGPGVSPIFRGIYELYGVVTHKGRDSNSGHYMGWVKQGPDSWLCFDDEHPAECKDEDIKKLAGETADWHINYMAYYRVKID